MNPIQGMQLLVKLKERRLAQLEDVAKTRKNALAEQVSALQRELTQERERMADEAAQRDKLFTLSSDVRGFRASDVVTMQGLLADAQQQVAAASKRARQAEKQVGVADEALREARRDVQRGQRQLEQCRERLAAARAEVERQQEDQQDEESEETAVARMLAQAAQAAQAHDEEFAA